MLVNLNGLTRLAIEIFAGLHYKYQNSGIIDFGIVSKFDKIIIIPNQLTVYQQGNFACFFVVCCLFSNIFSKTSVRNTFGLSINFDRDQARRFVGPNLVQLVSKCFQQTKLKCKGLIQIQGRIHGRAEISVFHNLSV